jgi:hypothetical protein
MAVTDGELLRTANALAATLNDQGLDELDAARLQEIVTGALGGERKLEVHRTSPQSGLVRDEHGHQELEVKLEDGVWSVRLLREPRSSSAYVPSDAGGGQDQR